MLSSLRLDCKVKKFFKSTSNLHISLSFYSFGIETINIHSYTPVETMPDSRPTWAKCIPIFRSNRHKNPTGWGDTYLYGSYTRIGGAETACELRSIQKSPKVY